MTQPTTQPNPKVYPNAQVAAAILRRGDAVVLVKENRGAAEFWSLPGGGVEFGELVTEALIREIKEETGVTLHSPGRLAYIVNSTTAEFPSSVALFFDTEDWDGEVVPADPDQDVLHAALFALDDALALLAESHASRPEIEPLVAYLRNPHMAPAIWAYRDDLPATASDPQSA